MPIIVIILITLIILCFPFLYFYKKSKMSPWIIFLGYIICATPMLYFYIDDVIQQYEDANIGLGLAIFSTWFLTVCMYITMFIYFLLRRKKK
ncbi:hypothetical protein F9279_04460 [Bacillus sp. B1-b2]|nr:hypothetical protein F9279_04460 [Bacillus sp. B1-b2]